MFEYQQLKVKLERESIIVDNDFGGESNLAYFDNSSSEEDEDEDSLISEIIKENKPIREWINYIIKKILKF